MRMRNKSWAKPLIENCNEFVVHEPSNMAGKWKQQLKCSELHLEIGCGKGDYWVLMADKHPECGWIGIEKNPNVAAIAIKKRIENPKSNALFIVDDAKDIENWFNQGELKVIHLNFSDPWPKKAHNKRRLSHAGFLNKYGNLLEAQGMIIMKTDNRSLFEFSLLEFAQNKWQLIEVNVDFRSEVQEDVISEYEQKFIDLNQPIYRAIWKKI